MELKRTPLFDLCLNAECRFGPFAGWEMPIQYSGLVNEHQAVRTKAGLFDISHMGIVEIQGQNSKDALQALVPSDLHRIGPGEACYTVLLNENGGIIDDLIIYDLGINDNNKQILLLVINAAEYSNDIAWLRKNLEHKNIEICNAKKDGILLAVQGPKAQGFLEQYCEQSLNSLPPFGHRTIQISEKNQTESTAIFMARTGYTGEDGFELLLPTHAGRELWQGLVKQGVTPCGLGARDTLRLEAGMHLYGNDMDSTTTPFEAGLGWLVHLEITTNFIGRNILETQAKQGIKKRLVSLKLEGRAIARKGYKVFHQNFPIGEVTSGTWSPTLGYAIALAYVPLEHSKIGNKLTIEIRGKHYSAEVVKKPFYRRCQQT